MSRPNVLDGFLFVLRYGVKFWLLVYIWCAGLSGCTGIPGQFSLKWTAVETALFAASFWYLFHSIELDEPRRLLKYFPFAHFGRPVPQYIIE
ncbi:hypothetical protein IFR05_015455 [Cadophora sp. M221]|nr:hypothetical protein IFR05_015455 [Cadophora sp. M221]